MSARNSDGRFRNHNKPAVLSTEMLRAQWVESEAMRLKRNGFSYEAIAEQITQVGRGQKVPVTPFPEGVDFPPDYRITAMGCHKATRRALRRAPTQEANEMRRFDTDRCEDMYLFLTPGIRQGDPQSVRAAVNVLAHKAAINGYKSAEIEVRVAPGPSWSSVMPNEQSVALYKEAMTLLIQAGLEVEELAEVAGLEARSVEVTARKVDEDDNK
jgi:LmbE family N-acetylglucosaminyl deacetylase